MPLLAVAMGGAIGSVGRYLVGVWAGSHGATQRWPTGTLLVNVIGCAVIGLIAGLSERGAFGSPDLRLFLMTGLIGGFTTFSAFGLETFAMLRRGDVTSALAYLLSSLVLGLLAVWIGWSLVARRAG